MSIMDVDDYTYKLHKDESEAAAQLMSELDKWFPRDEPKPEPEKKPEPGVIEGVKRPRKKRYVRRWWKAQRRDDERR